MNPASVRPPERKRAHARMQAVARVRRKPAVAAPHLVAAAIYGAAVATVQFSATKARNDGDLIVSKLDEYKKQHGDYPDRLDALAPAMLPAIPHPGPAGFIYSKSEDYYTLIYRSVAGNCFYRPGKAMRECRPN